MPDRPAWTIEFYADDNGREPIRKWLDGLSGMKRDAVLAALTHILSRMGPDACNSEWAKNLGQGLYELRIRHSAEETAAMFGGQGRGPKKGEAILLRLFFHPHGRRLVLLLGGYDKGREPSERRQQREIDAARRRLEDFRARERAARATDRRRARGQGGLT